MLLTREEMTFDFGDAKLVPGRDRELLEWIFNQFLYGEVTGIQVGQWLYDAPNYDAAKFLARQAVEEMQHVDNFLRIMEGLECTPKRAHWAIRFLATGMMGGSWAEHVSLEMATGEGFVLTALYALIDTLEHPETVEILVRAVRQEERHVEFGEDQTLKEIAGRPRLTRRLIGFHLISLAAVRRLGQAMKKRMAKQDHPVLKLMPAFLEHTNHCAELRMQRIGLITKPLAEFSGFEKLRMIVEAYAVKGLLGIVGFAKRLIPFWPRQRRLTDRYLQDPKIRNSPASGD